MNYFEEVQFNFDQQLAHFHNEPLGGPDKRQLLT
jgi:hypothetical protein